MVLQEIITFYCTVQTQVYNALDSVTIDSWTVLDIFTTFMYLGVTIKFINEMRGKIDIKDTPQDKRNRKAQIKSTFNQLYTKSSERKKWGNK